MAVGAEAFSFWACSHFRILDKLAQGLPLLVGGLRLLLIASAAASFSTTTACSFSFATTFPATFSACCFSLLSCSILFGGLLLFSFRLVLVGVGLLSPSLTSNIVRETTFFSPLAGAFVSEFIAHPWPFCLVLALSFASAFATTFGTTCLIGTSGCRLGFRFGGLTWGIGLHTSRLSRCIESSGAGLDALDLGHHFMSFLPCLWATGDHSCFIRISSRAVIPWPPIHPDLFIDRIPNFDNVLQEFLHGFHAQANLFQLSMDLFPFCFELQGCLPLFLLQVSPFGSNPHLSLNRRLQEFQEPHFDQPVDFTIAIRQNQGLFLLLQDVFVDSLPRTLQTEPQRHDHLLIAHAVTIIRQARNIFELLEKVFSFSASGAIITIIRERQSRLHFKGARLLPLLIGFVWLVHQLRENFCLPFQDLGEDRAGNLSCCSHFVRSQL